jgi:hypothetical protein
LCDLTALVLEHYSIGYRTERAPLAQFPRLHQRLPDCLASTRQIRALRFVWALPLIQNRSPSLTWSSIPYDTQLSPLHKTAHETCTLEPCWSSRQKLRVPRCNHLRRAIALPRQIGFRHTAKPSSRNRIYPPRIQLTRIGAVPSLDCTSRSQGPAICHPIIFATPVQRDAAQPTGTWIAGWRRAANHLRPKSTFGHRERIRKA